MKKNTIDELIKALPAIFKAAPDVVRTIRSLFPRKGALISAEENNIIGYVLGENIRIYYSQNWGSMSEDFKSDFIRSISTLSGRGSVSNRDPGDDDGGETCHGAPKPKDAPQPGFEWDCGINGWFQKEII